jgi:hypothetical protein
MEEQQQQKSKMKSMVGYKAITYYFQSSIHKKDDAQQLRFNEDLLLFVAKAYMPISIVEN